MRSILIAVVCLICHVAISQKTYDYPLASKEPVVNMYHTDSIIDTYQWMENPEDPRLAEWLAEQEKLNKKQQRKQTHYYTLRNQLYTMYAKSKSVITDEYIAKTGQKMSKYEFDYLYKRRDETADLLYRVRGNSNYRRIVQIKEFKRDKEDNPSIERYSVNEDYELLSVEMSYNGSDWREAYFFNLRTGEQLQDTLKYIRIGSNLIWHEDGVYYTRYNAAKEGRELLDKATGQALYYHKIGTNQEDDQLLYQNPDSTGTRKFHYSKYDSSRLILNHYYKSGDKIFKAISVAPIDKSQPFILKNFLLYPPSDTVNFHVELIINDTVYLRTNWNAPNYKVMLANVNEPNKLQQLVPQYNLSLREVNRLGKDNIACIYRKEGSFLVLIYNNKGKLLKRINFPEGKKLKYFYEYNPDAKYTEFSLSSFYHPDIWYQISLQDFSFKPYKKIYVPYDVNDLETRYVKYTSKDGTEIPMYITCLKKTKLNGKNPTLIYGYGGYGNTVEPFYNKATTLWLLHGGVLAIPNIRGGGAEGTEWSLAGRRLNKQNTIDDFIAAAEYLTAQKYTKPEKTAIKGGSHGGMLVASAAMQRPELFKAVIAEAGVYDLLRFEEFTVGSVATNEREFGNTSKLEDYKNLKSYSPLHNVKKGTKYPNMLLVTGDHDDRVPPLHTYKYLATLQQEASSEALYQLYTIEGAGHGGGITPDAFFNKVLFTQYFLFDQLGLKFW